MISLPWYDLPVLESAVIKTGIKPVFCARWRCAYRAYGSSPALFHFYAVNFAFSLEKSSAGSSFRSSVASKSRALSWNSFRVYSGGQSLPDL